MIAGVVFIRESHSAHFLQYRRLLVSYHIQPSVQNMIDLKSQIILFLDFMQSPISIRVHC